MPSVHLIHAIAFTLIFWGYARHHRRAVLVGYGTETALSLYAVCTAHLLAAW